MESGACSGPSFFSLVDATAQANALASAVGCTDAGCLRGKSPLEILSALPVRKETIGPGYQWGPIVGDGELPELPLDAMRAGHAAHVPLVLGTNANEGQLFTALYFGDVTTSDARAMVQWMFGAPNVDTILAQYPLSSYGSLKEEVGDIVTDGIFACPTRRAARAFTDSGGTAYLYEFAYPFQIPAAPGARAAHGFELPFIFGNGFFGTQLTDTEQPLSDAMVAYWSRFARGGDPNGAGAAAWPTYDATGDTNLVLDLTLGTLSGYKKARCDFWDSVH
jgi:para-nitrobenzyl esterase